MFSATFVMTTGRSGTQWLASQLAEAAGGRATVEHEPILDDYRPRTMLAVHDPHRLREDYAGAVLQHVEWIESVLAEREYIETGYPVWATLPWLAERLRGRIRIVHLVRHPVPVAFSWVTHRAYCTPFAAHTPERILLSPFDEGVRFPEYRDRWASLPPQEKVLYYWLEVNAAAMKLEQRTSAPWLRVRLEDLRGETLARLHAFVGLPTPAAAKGVVDEHRFTSDQPWDPARIADHPRVVELARQLGYDPFGYGAAKIEKRGYVSPLAVLQDS